MQFTKIAALLFTVAASVSATPAPDAAVLAPFELHARSCGAGLLRGSALKLCQQACKAACTVIPIPVASAACAASCDQKPVKARDELDATEAAEETAEAIQKRNVEARACGLFKGNALKLCQEGCSAVCTAIPIAAAKDACVASCKAGSLKVRNPEPAPAPLTGGQVCRGACAVTCNSTVLALIQKKCLSVCNGKCPTN